MNPATPPLHTPRRVSVSTWALHSLVGTVAPGRPGDPDGTLMSPHPGMLDLLEVPARLAALNIHTMEVCHFHLPTRDPAYLGELQSAARDAGVEIWSLLVDDGDITHPTEGDRDREWVRDWIDSASYLGARCVRVIAGKQEATPDTLARSRAQMATLAVEAFVRGLHLTTENWFALLSQPAAVNDLLHRLNGAVGLCLDFGNWQGDDKYDRLAQIAPRAVSCHAKCNYTNGTPDTDDFRRCLALLDAAGFSGPFTLVYAEPGRVWETVAEQRDLLTPFVTQDL